jgi:hypothetical protein
MRFFTICLAWPLKTPCKLRCANEPLTLGCRFLRLQLPTESYSQNLFRLIKGRPLAGVPHVLTQKC